MTQLFCFIQWIMQLSNFHKLQFYAPACNIHSTYNAVVRLFVATHTDLGMSWFWAQMSCVSTRFSSGRPLSWFVNAYQGTLFIAHCQSVRKFEHHSVLCMAQITAECGCSKMSICLSVCLSVCLTLPLCQNV